MDNKNFDDLEKKLLLNLRALLPTLYPQGKISGREFQIANVTGEAGKSLKINLETGRWSDFSVTEGGSSGRIVGFFAYRNGGYEKGEEEIRQLLNLPRKVVKNYSKLKITWEDVFDKLSDPIRYLSEQRGIPLSVLRKSKVRSEGNHYIFTATNEDGTPAFAEFVNLDRPGGKKELFWKPKNYRPVLWGMCSMQELCDYKRLVICEGKIDALTYRSLGVYAVSIPSGITSLKWIDECWNWLSQFDSIYLSMDYDAAGQEQINNISGRLGSYKCRKIVLPEKDANEVLLNNPDDYGQVILECIQNAQDITPEKTLSVTEVKSHVVSFIEKGDTANTGDLFMGWDVCPGAIDDGSRFRFRPREMTIHSGYTGHGKTTALFQHCAHSIFTLDQSVAIATLEESYEKTITTIIQQTIGMFPDHASETSMKLFDWCYSILEKKLFIFNEIGKAKLEEVLDFFDYYTRRKGVNHRVLDSIMMTDVDIDGDKVRVNDMIQKILDSNNKSKSHCHIVAHCVKGDDDTYDGIPSIKSVKGIQELTAKAHNVIFTWRNKAKEKGIAGSVSKGQAEEAERKAKEKGDTIFIIAKDRNGKTYGQVNAWFDKPSNRFRPTWERERIPHYIPA